MRRLVSLSLVIGPCLLVTCLVGRPNPAEAFAMFEGSAGLSLSVLGSSPTRDGPFTAAGWSLTWGDAVQFSESRGNASAAVTVLATQGSGAEGPAFISVGMASAGSARAPSITDSRVVAGVRIPGVLTNTTTAPLTLWMFAVAGAFSDPNVFGEPGLIEMAGAGATMFVDPGFAHFVDCVNGSTFPGFGCFRENREDFAFRLDPGPHELLVSLELTGFATSTLEPVPEPTTLLLLGTTAAGLGFLARRRRRQPAAS